MDLVVLVDPANLVDRQLPCLVGHADLVRLVVLVVRLILMILMVLMVLAVRLALVVLDNLLVLEALVAQEVLANLEIHRILVFRADLMVHYLADRRALLAGQVVSVANLEVVESSSVLSSSESALEQSLVETVLVELPWCLKVDCRTQQCCTS